MACWSNQDCKVVEKLDKAYSFRGHMQDDRGRRVPNSQAKTSNFDPHSPSILPNPLPSPSLRNGTLWYRYLYGSINFPLLFTTRQYAPSGPLACSSHATFTMHSSFTVEYWILTSLMPICTPRMNTLSSRKQSGDLEEIDHRGWCITSRRSLRIGFYKNFGLRIIQQWLCTVHQVQIYFETLDGKAL